MGSFSWWKWRRAAATAAIVAALSSLPGCGAMCPEDRREVGFAALAVVAAGVLASLEEHDPREHARIAAGELWDCKPSTLWAGLAGSEGSHYVLDVRGCGRADWFECDREDCQPMSER